MLKKNKKYIFFRIYTISVLLSGFIFSKFNYFIYVPFLFSAIFILIIFVGFKFDYSIFGKHLRTPLPNEDKIMEENPLSISIVSFGVINTICLFPELYVYNSGLGISFFASGNAFISINDLEKINLNKLYGFIYHRSEEIHSPIMVPKSIAEKLKELLPHNE